MPNKYTMRSVEPELADAVWGAVGDIVENPARLAELATALGVPTPRFVPLLAGRACVDLTTADLVGGSPGAFAPADYALGGLTLALALRVGGSVSGAGLTGVVELVDDLGATVATLNVTATTTTHHTAAVAVPGAPRVYELRARLTTSSGPSDCLTLTGAALRLSWS